MEEGLYRAPKSRDQLNAYYWFCLDHVRLYNAAWNYFEGMSEPEIEAHIRRATIWDRPSWSLSAGQYRQAEQTVYDDLFRDFGFGTGPGGPGGSEYQASAPAAAGELAALSTLGLEPPADFAMIKARYRVLVKQHHPDANGGSRDAEERLKSINQAYGLLKGIYAQETAA